MKKIQSHKILFFIYVPRTIDRLYYALMISNKNSTENIFLVEFQDGNIGHGYNVLTSEGMGTYILCPKRLIKAGSITSGRFVAPRMGILSPVTPDNNSYKIKLATYACTVAGK